jgi:prepilin-type processing-associated H-X9-DG protein
MLPSLGSIAKDMKPSCRVSWMGPDGLYVQCRGPGVDMSLSSIAGVAVAAGVAMPAIARARDQARRVASMSNLKQIGLACIMYADDNNGSFPADLQGLQKYLGSPEVLESPRKPKDFTGPSYIYVPGQTRDTDMHNVLVYENPEFSKDRVNALFPDGHVEAMQPDQFRQELEATYKRLGKPMPDVRLKGEVEVKPPAPVRVEPSNI